MRIDSAIITGSFSVNGDTFNDLGSYSTTGSNAFTGSQNITGSLVVSGSFNLTESASAFQIQGNGFGQTYLQSPNGAIVLNPGYGGVEITGVNNRFSATDAYITNLYASNGVVSGSSQIVGILSPLNSYTQSNDTTNTTQNTRLNNLEEKTGSLATTGSNTFYGQQVFSGSLYVQDNLIVQGSSSLQNITASAVSIGTNIVYLNTDTPAVRFAGLTVQDSGSSAGVTGSMLWDSLCNRWIYSNPSTIGYSGGMLLSGPRTQTLGTEPTLTCNYIAKSGGGDHLYDSCIIDDGTTTCIKNNLVGIGTISGTTIYGSTAVCSIVGKFTTCIDAGTGTFSGDVTINKNNSTDAVFKVQQSTNFYASAINLVAANQGGAIYNYINSGVNGATPMWQIGGGATTDTMVMYTAGSERMRITNCGNIGIGVTPSNWANGTESALQIKNASIYEYGAYEMGLQVNAVYNTLVAPSGWKYISTGIQCVGQLQLSGGDLTYNVANPGTAGCGITWNTKFNINRTGNVGINTTSQNPSSVLHVRMCSNSNGDGIRVQAMCTGGAGSQPGIAFSNTSDCKRWNIAMDTNSDTLQITNAGGSNVFNVTQSCVVCLGPVTIVGMQGGADNTVISGGSGYGSAISMKFANGAFNNYLAGNGDNFFNCVTGKLNAQGGIKFGGGSGTLNYYEQGTWTPRLTNGSFTSNASADNGGWYIRIGNIVTVGGTLGWSGGSGPQDGNSLRIACLPFAANNTVNHRSVGQFGAPATDSIGFKNVCAQMVLVVDPGASFIYIIQAYQNGSYLTYRHDPLVANAGILYGFQATYQI
jgi:hypothetical protein